MLNLENDGFKIKNRSLLKSKEVENYLKNQLLDIKDFHHIWFLTDKDDEAIIHASVNDLFIFRVEEHTGSGYIWNFDVLEKNNFTILKTSRLPVSKGQMGANTVVEILAWPKKECQCDIQLKEIQSWNPKDDPRFLNITFHIGPRQQENTPSTL